MLIRTTRIPIPSERGPYSARFSLDLELLLSAHTRRDNLRSCLVGTNLTLSTLRTFTRWLKYYFKWTDTPPWLGGSVGWNVILSTKMLWLSGQDTGSTQVVVSVPGRSTYGGRPVDVSVSHRCLSLSLSAPSSFSKINKNILRWGKRKWSDILINNIAFTRCNVIIWWL